MSTYLSVQSTYTHLQMALMKESDIIDETTCAKRDVSRDFIVQLSALLERNGLVVTDLPFIAVNQGPGPFTSLRTVLASVNGLSFATSIPLIGIDGLDAALDEYADERYPVNVLLLNAFNRDIYFAVRPIDGEQKGYEKIEPFLTKLEKQPTDSIYFFGNGAELYQREIRFALGDRAIFADPLPQTCSIGQVGLAGLAKWRENSLGSRQLTPLYLKQISRL